MNHRRLCVAHIFHLSVVLTCEVHSWQHCNKLECYEMNDRVFHVFLVGQHVDVDNLTMERSQVLNYTNQETKTCPVADEKLRLVVCEFHDLEALVNVWRHV
jgi:hypothetical protein